MVFIPFCALSEAKGMVIIMKWKAKIRQGLLIEEWFIKADRNLSSSNYSHFEFIAKNEGIIISETGYLSHFKSCIEYEEKDIPGIIRDALRFHNRLKNDDVEIISIIKIKNKINN